MFADISRLRPQLVALLLVAGVVIAPLVRIDSYVMGILITSGIYAIYAVSLDLIIGFLGVYSFGHAAFFGLGAYTAGVLSATYGWDFWMTLPVAVLLCGALGLIFTLPGLRTRGIYFAITTLACAEITRLVIVSAPRLTRGYMGLSLSDVVAPFGLPVLRDVAFFYVTFSFLLLICFLVVRLLHSRFGRAVIAIRENEALAESVGVPAVKVTVMVFVLSSSIAGLAGALYAGYIGIASPLLVSVSYSALPLLMVIVGGRGTVWGAVAGALVFTLIPELFRVADEGRMILFSVLLIVSMLAMPRGLVAPLLRLVAPTRRKT